MENPSSSPGMPSDEVGADTSRALLTARQSPGAGEGAGLQPLDYPQFAAALKDALRDFHRHDLLARNPLLRSFGNPSGPAGPQHLRELLITTVSALFENARDEKLRRVIELTYFQAGPKQEAVADRLSMAFGTYRRHLTTARDRLTSWLWDSSGGVPLQLGPTRPSDGSPPDEIVLPALSASVLPRLEPLTTEASAPRLSLVVLPFLNIGGTAEDEAFVDGVTETLTTDLSRALGIVVISRNTAFAYKGRPIDSRQIGRELGVRFVLEGSVLNAGDSVRINVQLVDAENSAHLWAERFDKQRAGLLEMQDEVVAQLSRAIYIELIAAESQRAAHEPVDHLDTVDHALRGWAAWNQRRSRQVARQARASFEAALRLDSNNISALLGLADTHIWEVNSFISEDRPGQIRAAEAAAKNALELAPRSAAAHLGYGRVLFAMSRPERALRELELARRLDRNLAAVHGYLGQIKIALGRVSETRAHVEEAMRLSPQDPLYASGTT